MRSDNVDHESPDQQICRIYFQSWIFDQLRNVGFPTWKGKGQVFTFADFEKGTVTFNGHIWDWRNYGTFAHKSIPFTFVNLR